MRARYGAPKRVDTGQCVSENAKLRKGWMMRFHIDWREERVSARMLRFEGRVNCEIPRLLERETKHSL